MLANSRSPELEPDNLILTYEDEELDDFDDLDDFDENDFEDDIYVGDEFNGNGDFEDFLDEEEADTEYTH